MLFFGRGLLFDVHNELFRALFSRHWIALDDIHVLLYSCWLDLNLRLAALYVHSTFNCLIRKYRLLHWIQSRNTTINGYLIVKDLIVFDIITWRNSPLRYINSALRLLWHKLAIRILILYHTVCNFILTLLWCLDWFVRAIKVIILILAIIKEFEQFYDIWVFTDLSSELKWWFDTLGKFVYVFFSKQHFIKQISFWSFIC